MAIALGAFAGVILLLIDKIHTEVVNSRDELNAAITKSHGELHDYLNDSFSYHGIIDSPKSHFNANEMRDKWPRIVEVAKIDFLAVNYLSPACWKEYNGDYLVPVIGSRMKIINLKAKRLFIIDNINELPEWASTVSLHCMYDIPVKWILFQDFIENRTEYVKYDAMFQDTLGFNVVDTKRPGIVIDWDYVGRKTDGADMKLGSEPAKSYCLFFERIWNLNSCHDFPA